MHMFALPTLKKESYLWSSILHYARWINSISSISFKNLNLASHYKISVKDRVSKIQLLNSQSPIILIVQL